MAGVGKVAMSGERKTYEASMRPVILTGGAGYIGSHAAKYLRARNFLPVVYDNLSRGHREHVLWGPLEVGSLDDGDALRRCLDKHRPVAAMHFAAFAYVEESVKDPDLYHRNNVLGALSLLDALADRGVRRLVFSSSCATYGVPARIPIPEDEPQNPINPYGQGKLEVERALDEYRGRQGLESVILRYFNAAGADPEARIGEWHEPESHLIPILLDVALGLRPEALIHGDDYPTPDGTCIRDFVHVEDIAQAHHLALERLLSGGGSGRFNLGSASGHSVREVIQAVERVTGRTLPVRVTSRRTGDPPALVGSADKARRELGWKPAYDGLDGIIRTAWAWHLKRRGQGFPE
jgi:UDP-arabinose 4-epimerase